MPYSRPPIVESVIDVQVASAALPPLDVVLQLANELKAQFPLIHRIDTLSMALGHDVQAGGFASNTQTQSVGYRLTTESGDRVLQVRRQGISLSHIGQYKSWPLFSGEMRSLLRLYLERFSPTSVTRLAVRYINRIAIPQSSDLDDFMNIAPRLIDSVCPEVEGYFMQLVLPQRDLGDRCKAIINTGIESSPDPSQMSLLLDVDLFTESPITTEDVEIWNVLDRLRDRKNEIFEAAITDRVREMIR